MSGPRQSVRRSATQTNRAAEAFSARRGTPVVQAWRTGLDMAAPRHGTAGTAPARGAGP